MSSSGSGGITTDRATEYGVDAHAAPKVCKQFRDRADKDGMVRADKETVKQIIGSSAGPGITEEEASALLELVNGEEEKIDFQKFCELYVAHSNKKGRQSRKTGQGVLNQVAGAVGVHTYAHEERVAFAEHLNNCMKKDEFLTERGYIPIEPQSPENFFESLRDGILLGKLINQTQPDTIDERTLNVPKKGKKLNPWETKENLNLVINSAKAIGCHIVNIHAADFMNTIEEHKEYLVLGVVWQVVKMQLLSEINLQECPELAKLLREGEELQDFMKLPAEDVLLRWINHHIQHMDESLKMKNFSSDVKNGEVYANLLDSVEDRNGELKKEILAKEDSHERAQKIIEEAKRLGVETFIQPRDIASGNKRLNLAFCAQMFNQNPGLVEDEEEKEEYKAQFETAETELEEDDNDSREERTFRMWMNSLNLQGGNVYVHNLIDELADGTIILDTMDYLKPKIIDQKKVSRPKEGKTFNKFNQVGNCNYAVDKGKELGFSLPGTGGIDINNKNRKLILGFVWQLMRMQVLETLKEVGGGKIPKDEQIISWANKRVQDAGKSTKINSFRDKSISDGRFLLDLLDTIEPRAVNPELITPGETDEEKKKNARYVISVARKIGATVFLSWEDIVDVKPKMIMTLIASIMAVAAGKDQDQAPKQETTGGGANASAANDTKQAAGEEEEEETDEEEEETDEEEESEEGDEEEEEQEQQ